MHKTNILILGPKSFISTLVELKTHFNFSLTVNQNNLSNETLKNFEGIICHEDNRNNPEIITVLSNSECFKILATKKDKYNKKNFDCILQLPTTIAEINALIESSLAKKKFSKNSSIKIKSYLLDKNEKKLIKSNSFVVLTEKEIQLLELLLMKKKTISKNEILSLVWKYAMDVDTHTVETHIYRLRKKIQDKFMDNKFIFNNKEGYYL